MQPVRYSINITLDGCCDHRLGVPDEEMHRYYAGLITGADALVFGRVIYGMMESAWRPIAAGERPEGVPEWTVPFAKAIDVAKKYVISNTLETVDWNSEIVRGNQLEATVRALREKEGRGVLAGGLQVPLALAELGLIDEYEFVVQPRIAGHGPTLFAGLSRVVDLQLVGRHEFGGGSVVMRYVPKR